MYPENPNEGNPFEQRSTPYSPTNNNFSMQLPVPNATTVLVLGIVSIVTACCCYGIVGMLLAIITLSMAKKGKAIYNANPQAYTPQSMSNIETGRICAIVALVIGVIALLIYIVIFSMYGIGVMLNPSEWQDMVRNA